MSHTIGWYIRQRQSHQRELDLLMHAQLNRIRDDLTELRGRLRTLEHSIESSDLQPPTERGYPMNGRDPSSAREPSSDDADGGCRSEDSAAKTMTCIPGGGARPGDGAS